MRRKLLMGIIGLLVLVSATAFGADARNFTIVNDTGYPIKFLGVNPPGDEVWNENEVSGILENKASIKVEFTQREKGCSWNIKVTWADDNTSSIFRGLDLCTINVVRLKYDRATDTASFTTE